MHSQEFTSGLIKFYFILSYLLTKVYWNSFDMKAYLFLRLCFARVCVCAHTRVCVQVSGSNSRLKGTANSLPKCVRVGFAAAQVWQSPCYEMQGLSFGENLRLCTKYKSQAIFSSKNLQSNLNGNIFQQLNMDFIFWYCTTLTLF